MPPTAQDLYSVVSDIMEQMTGLRGAVKKKMVAEAKRLVKEARKMFPSARVPSDVAHKFVPFNYKNVLADLHSMGYDEATTEATVVEFDVDIMNITIGGGEWRAVRDDDDATRLAEAIVRQDLEENPEIFNRDFIERHIDQDKLKKYVYDVRMDDDYVDELAEHQTDDFWRMAEGYGIDIPEESEENDWTRPDPSDELIRHVKEKYAEEASSDPMSFFNDLYGQEEAVARAIEAAGIDVESAAKDAVHVDGFEHFIGNYDNNYQETPAGFILWRVN